jgi:hypothetical protein
MIDTNLLVRKWLLTSELGIEGQTVENQVPIVLASHFTAGAVPPNDTPNRVYGGHLVPGFDPQFGPGLVVRVGSGASAGTGGGSSRSEVPIREPRVYLTSWADKNQFDIARELYGAAYDWMQRRNNIDLGEFGFIFSCLEQVEGQDIDDPHTGFATVMGIWKVMIPES